ncbi:hypothetical protein IFR05_013975 [Cadophora sp. M221]|nr:hypothetical protein IFR05_013975 [Cadophora sp. M221]
MAFTHRLLRTSGGVVELRLLGARSFQASRTAIPRRELHYKLPQFSPRPSTNLLNPRNSPQARRILQSTLGPLSVPYSTKSGKKPGTWRTLGSVLRNNIYFRTIVVLVVCGTIYYYISHIETVPGSSDGRRRFMVGTADAVTRQCLVKYALLKKEWKDKLLGLEDERTRRVHRVLERLIAANHLEKGVLGGKWEVMVVDSLESEQLVVSILPGSKVILNTSSITFCTHDSELAQLISHQLAHVLLEHRRESMSHFSIYTPIMWILITLDWKMLVGQLFILGGLDFFVLGKAAQAREFEADRLGMILAAKAGYDPSAAIEVWGKLDRLEERLLSDCSTLSAKHLRERIDAMVSLQPEMEKKM